MHQLRLASFDNSCCHDPANEVSSSGRTAHFAFRARRMSVFAHPACAHCATALHPSTHEVAMSQTVNVGRAAAGAAFLFAATALVLSGEVLAVDAAAAEALARQNNCFKCHAVDKKKTGPAWKDVAAKFKGNKDAEAKLTTHLNTGPDGHPTIKAKSPEDTKNLVQWILSL
jgi:cytochrome c